MKLADYWERVITRMTTISVWKIVSGAFLALCVFILVRQVAGVKVLKALNEVYVYDRPYPNTARRAVDGEPASKIVTILQPGATARVLGDQTKHYRVITVEIGADTTGYVIYRSGDIKIERRFFETRR